METAVLSDPDLWRERDDDERDPAPEPDDNRWTTPRETGPNLLPGDVADFTGRPDELAWLTDALDADGRRAPALVVVSGKGGVGKSALAVHVAHRLHGSFPGGALYLDLQGTGQRPVPAAEALERLLRALHAPRIPQRLGERAELYRALLADRRVLIVLDDAGAEEQVEPLLPGTGPSAVIVTGRHLLAGLHAERLPLEPLTEGPSVELLGRAVGPARIEAEPMPARELARLCDGLPLALRIAATRLISRPHWTVARLVHKLAPENQRLDELAHSGRSVRASLDLSFRALDAGSRSVLQRLAQVDERRYRAPAVAKLLGTDPALVEDVLDRLVEVHALEVEQTGAGRADGTERVYRMRPLERLLARETDVPRHHPQVRTGT